MGSEQHFKRSRREPRAGKVEALLDAKLKGVEWGEFRLEEVFEIVGTKSLDSNAIDFTETGINFVGRTFENNGIQGKIQKQTYEPNKPFTITATVIGNYKYVKFQKEYYYCSQNINKLTPKEIICKWNEKIAYYFISYIQKLVSLYDKQQGGYKLPDIQNHNIQLPTKNNKIDFEFMENFISEIEAQKVERLEAYLVENGLKEYRLSDEENEVLRDFESGNIEWGEFKIGDLFEKLNLKTHKKPFDKVKDTSSIPTDEFSLPLVNAKFGNNGVMFYGREEDFDSAEMTIDIISNGAIATGTVYAQPHKTGVLWDAYLLKAVVDDITKNKLLYLSTSIEKSIKLKFGWDNKAVWSKVQHKLFSLPTKNNQPDYALMQTFISAVQKLVVKDVVLYVENKKGKRI